MVMSVKDLIKTRMKYLGIKNSEFVIHALRYKNVNKGMRLFQKIIDGEELDIKYLSSVASVLKVEERELIESMIETAKERIRREEKALAQQRDEFVPYFFSVHERTVPSPIFVGNITHNRRFVYYHKDMLKYTLEEQLKLIRFDIVSHYQENEGFIMGFGKITHYVYRHDFDAESQHLTALDVHGNVIESNGLHMIEGRPGGLFVRNRRSRIDQLMHYKKQINDNRN